MDGKELKKLRRTDLLEMLLTLRRENDQLRQQLKQAQQQLESRRILIEDAGSIAEASLRINGLFEAAQRACDQYAENIQRRCAVMEQETKARCDAMIKSARKQTESYEWLTDILDNDHGDGKK